MSTETWTQLSYLVAAALFILGLEAHELAGHRGERRALGGRSACCSRRW